MCGIAGFHLKHEGDVKAHDGMELFASTLLSGIESRGRQATGFVAVTQKGSATIDKRPLNAKEFIKVRKRLPKGTRTFLGHTRLATQGSNENNANLHPVIAGTCLATHNGGIWNDDTLFDTHSLKRAAEVDTEIIPALIHKFGWEAADKALHELRGSFAIAAIDLGHPGEVLLAKGDFSPLYWIETKQFVVWASTVSAIQDAWKLVLGTPPQYKQFDQLKEGDMLWLKGKVIEPAKFELPSDPFRRADNPAKKTTSHSDGRGTNGKGGTLHPIFGRREGVASYTKRGIIVDRKEEVKQLRADGYGKAIIHGDKTHDELLELVDGKIVFLGCSGCGSLILEENFVYRNGEGRICTDCNYIAQWGSNTVKLNIDQETREHLNAWCKKETGAHVRALFEVARLSNLDVATVDYLVFRLPEKYANDHPNMADLAGTLDEMYQEAYTAAFDDVLDETLDVDKKAQRGSEDEKPWAIDNNNHRQCATCHKYKRAGDVCKPCEKKAAEKEDKAVTVDTFRCWCGETADKTVGGIVGFCHYHYSRCNIEDCGYGISEVTKNRGVVAKANHLLTDGRRVCHNHARSVKGAFSDTTLEKKGVIVRDLAGSSVGGL